MRSWDIYYYTTQTKLNMITIPQWNWQQNETWDPFADSEEACVSCKVDQTGLSTCIICILNILSSFRNLTLATEPHISSRFVWAMQTLILNALRRTVTFSKTPQSLGRYCTSARRWPEWAVYWDSLWVCPGKKARCWSVAAGSTPSASSATSAGAGSRGSPSVLVDGSLPQLIKRPEMDTDKKRMVL